MKFKGHNAALAIGIGCGALAIFFAYRLIVEPSNWSPLLAGYAWLTVVLVLTIGCISSFIMWFSNLNINDGMIEYRSLWSHWSYRLADIENVIEEKDHEGDYCGFTLVLRNQTKVQISPLLVPKDKVNLFIASVRQS